MAKKIRNYVFRQNNVRGSLDGPETVTIQAKTYKAANRIASRHPDIDLYDYCECCGMRWELFYSEDQIYPNHAEDID